MVRARSCNQKWHSRQWCMLEVSYTYDSCKISIISIENYSETSSSMTNSMHFYNAFGYNFRANYPNDQPISKSELGKTVVLVLQLLWFIVHLIALNSQFTSKLFPNERHTTRKVLLLNLPAKNLISKIGLVHCKCIYCRHLAFSLALTWYQIVHNWWWWWKLIPQKRSQDKFSEMNK